jgi:hypothetical protein
VTSQKIDLQLFDFGVGNPDVAELAEPGCHAVDRVIPFQRAIYHRPAQASPGARFLCQRDFLEIQGNLNNFVAIQRFAVKNYHTFKINLFCRSNQPVFNSTIRAASSFIFPTSENAYLKVATAKAKITQLKLGDFGENPDPERRTIIPIFYKIVLDKSF